MDEEVPLPVDEELLLKRSWRDLPFPVHSWQRKMLNDWKAKAVAKETELQARKKERLEELQRYVRHKLTAKSTSNKHRSRIQESSAEGYGSRVESIGSNRNTIPENYRTHSSSTSTQMLLQDRDMPLSRSPIPPLPVYIPTASTSTSRKPDFSLLGALVKGFLTRKLFYSNKVQFTVTTIKDSLGVLKTLSNPTTEQDRILKDRMETQLSVARLTLHEIFFQLPSARQMAYISHSRNLEQHKKLSQHQQPQVMQNQRPSARVPEASRVKSTTGPNKSKLPVGGKRLSSATIKCMQRRERSNRGAFSNM